MAKNAQGSWVGTSVQPQYQTYQTAGMLRPATSAPTSNAQSFPIADMTAGINFDPILGVGGQDQGAAATDRSPLVNAVVAAMGRLFHNKRAKF